MLFHKQVCYDSNNKALFEVRGIDKKVHQIAASDVDLIKCQGTNQLTFEIPFDAIQLDLEMISSDFCVLCY